MRLLLLLLGAALGFGGCRCLDPDRLQGFACEADGGCGLNGYQCCATGVCRTTCSIQEPGPDGSAACSASNCPGCCEGNVCRAGGVTTSCGTGGAACLVCDSATQHCQENACVSGADPCVGVACAPEFVCRAGFGCVSVSCVGVACPIDERCESGTCGADPQVAIGGACTRYSECPNRFCVQNVCCSSACNEACGSCASGQCAPRAEGTSDAGCGAFVCDGLALTCPTQCTTVAQCAAGRFCDGGGCLAAKSLGQQCSAATECVSGFCADGVCCNDACSGSCDRCDFAGTCRPAPINDLGVPPCGGAVKCNGSLHDCPIPCTGGCPTGTYCPDAGTYCAAKKPIGLPCVSTNECSVSCVTGVCCDTACTGTCQACSAATGGVCTNLGPSKTCRPKDGGCDVAETCNGTPNCPANAFVDAGQICGLKDAGSCTYDAGVCSTVGWRVQTRYICDGATAICGSSVTSAVQSCTRNTNGTVCKARSCTACSFCVPDCSRVRDCTDFTCGSGACSGATAEEVCGSCPASCVPR